MGEELIVSRWVAFKLAMKLFNFATGTSYVGITTTKDAIVIVGRSSLGGLNDQIQED